MRLMGCHLDRGGPAVGRMGGSGRICRGRPGLSFFYRAHACHPSPEKVINLPSVEKPQNELNGIKCVPRERARLADSPSSCVRCWGLWELKRHLLNEGVNEWMSEWRGKLFFVPLLLSFCIFIQQICFEHPTCAGHRVPKTQRGLWPQLLDLWSEGWVWVFYLLIPCPAHTKPIINSCWCCRPRRPFGMVLAISEGERDNFVSCHVAK